MYFTLSLFSQFCSVVSFHLSVSVRSILSLVVKFPTTWFGGLIP